MHPSSRFFLGFVAAVTVAGGADGQEVQPDVIKSLNACRTIADNAARLDCFDAAAKQIDAAIDQNKLTILDQEGIRRKKRSLFGFALPELSLFGRADTAATPAPSEIKSTIRQIGSIGNGKYELVLDDGAHWQTTEPAMVTPVTGSSIRIKRGALGSYFIFLEQERPIRGRRVK